MAGDRRRPLLAAGLGLLLAAALVGGLELAARQIEASRIPDHAAPRSGPRDPVTLQPHPYLLWEHAPGARQEQGVEVHINSLGLRGPEPRLPKPAGVRRILAVGDSTVYGFGVPLEDAFVQVAARALGGADHGLEGLPAALPGYSTLQLLNLLQLRALRLEPDLLVLAPVWSDNATSALEDAQLMDRYQRYDRSITGALDRSLRRVALYRLLAWELSVRRGAQATARADYSFEQPHPEGSLQRVPVERYRANLEALAGLAQDHGAALAYMVLPHPADLRGDDEGHASYHPYRLALRQAAAANHAPLVEGGEVLARAAKADPRLDIDALFLDNIHPTVQGHLLLGQALAQALAEWEQQTRP